MTSHTQEMPLLDQVLHLYDKSSTKVLAYFTVVLVATITALTLDQGFGIAPASVLIYVSVLIAVLVIGGPIAYVAYPAFHRPKVEDVSARVSESSLDNEELDAEPSLYVSFDELAVQTSVLTASGRYVEARENFEKALALRHGLANRRTLDEKWRLKAIGARFYHPHHIPQDEIDYLKQFMRLGTDVSALRRQLDASSFSDETKLILHRVLTVVWTCRPPIFEPGKSAEFRDGCEYGVQFAKRAFMHELIMEILGPFSSPQELPDEERPDVPLPFDTPLPDVYPGFFNPRKTK